MRSDSISPHIAQAAARLAIDCQSEKLVEALSSAGIPALLLKGAALDQRLYGRGGGHRNYADSDILVPPSRRRDVVVVLRGMGYSRTDVDPEQAVHATTWGRIGECHDAIDLHHTLPGGVRDSHLLWDALWEDREYIELVRRRVAVLGPAGTAMLLAIHVTRPNRDDVQPIEDLRRGLELLTLRAWQDAAVLARATGLSKAFARGLRTQAPALADRIGAPSPSEDLEHLLFEGQIPGSNGLHLVMTAGNRRARMEALARRVAPPVDLVRMAEHAAPGRRGLATAYLRRWRRLSAQAPAAVAAWTRARRATRDSAH